MTFFPFKSAGISSLSKVQDLILQAFIEPGALFYSFTFNSQSLNIVLLPSNQEKSKVYAPSHEEEILKTMMEKDILKTMMEKEIMETMMEEEILKTMMEKGILKM